MKFLCSNCKAKYQIADEKLEGRAVRMKCRKCGHIIEVPSPSTAGSVAQRMPAAPESSKPPPPKPTPSPAGARALPRPATRPAAPARPLGKPLPPRPGSSLTDVAAKLADAPPRSTAGGALADAFSQSVKDPDQADVSAAIEVLSAGAGEEWYVGINGVPLGPVRLSTLRQKASQGVIDEDSLVWREGFEEWLPLRTFPELVMLVKEARESAGRPSFTPAPPAPRRSGFGPAAPRLSPAAPFGGAVPMPTGPEPPTTRPGAAAEMEEDLATVIAASPMDLAAQIGMTGTGLPAAPPAGGLAPGPISHPASSVSVGMVTADPFAVADEPSDSQELPRKSIVDDFAVGVRRQVRMHPAAYVLIAIAFGFGATGAIVFFTGDRTPPPPPTIQVVTVTAPPPNVATAPGATETAPATSVALNIEGDPRAGRDDNGSKPTSPTSTEPNGKGTDEKGTGSLPPRVGLGDGPSVEGPSVGGPGGVDSTLPQQLDQGDIERVVSSHRVSVKRGCWEPALAARDPKAPKSAKVTVSITIGPNGNVTSASASGGTGFPSLASCVASRVRAWSFPRSGGESRANIPFAFFSQ